MKLKDLPIIERQYLTAFAWRAAMTTLCGIIILIVLAVALRAADTPAFTDKEKLEIRNAQNESMNLTLQMVNLEAQYRDLQTKRDAANQKANAEVEKAFKAHGLKVEDWSLDQNLALVPAPKKKP